MYKLIKGKQPVAETPMHTDFSAFVGFSGEFPNCHNDTTWILDSGASTHMCRKHNIFDKMIRVKSTHEVILPDEAIK